MPIYKQYDQAALDNQYNNRLRVPDYATYFERWESLSRQAEKEYSVIKDISYGKWPRECLDIYPSAQPRSKTLVFIHGGYWQKLDKALFHFVARSFLPAHVTTVLITYPLAPVASMDEMVSSCRDAIYWLYHHVSSFHGDPEQLYLAGHSAGGHLAAMLAATQWEQLYPDLPANTIKGACAISGLFNLVPIQLSELNSVLRMDTETALRNSPVRLQPARCPLVLGVGEDESEEFKAQSEELYTRWKEQAQLQLLELPGCNHYWVMDAFADPASLLHRAMKELMKAG